MKRKGIVLLVFLLVLFIVPMNPSLFSYTSDRVTDTNTTKDFQLSVDGAESSESITSFAETLGEDVWYYPDGDLNTSIQVASAGKTVADSTGGDYTDTQSMGTDLYTISETVGPYDGYIYLNFTVSVNYGQTINLNFFGCYDVITASTKDIEVYDGATWDDVGDMVYDGTFPFYDNGWTNVTLSSDYIISEIVMMRVHVVDTVATHIYINYCEIALAWPLLSDSNHFAESFSDVSEINATLGETVTTDGDLGTFHHPGDNAWDYYYFNDPSSLAVQVIEWRTYANISSSSYEFALYSADDGGGSQLWTSGSITAPTSAATKKYSPMVTGVESIRLATRHASSPSAFIFDYLRGSLSTEAGWSHDGSTTTGISSADGGTIATDGDLVTLTADGDGSTFLIVADTTATAAAISCTYYPMFGIDIDSGSGSWALEQYDGSAYATLQSSTAISTGIKRFNMKALDTYVSWWRITLTASAVLVSDWAKAYSIANFTVSQHPSTPTTDYYYVDENADLVRVASAAWWIEMNRDPALSVATSTYNVCNITSSGLVSEGGSSDYGFLEYVGASRWVYDTSRFALTSGTMTDCRIVTQSSITISAIKFISDGTAPTVIRSFATPDPADDDETVTLSAVVEDSVLVYEVNFNAITYPVGFSDVDYSATESTDNLWTYSFSTLTAGYYCFKILGSDGANLNALTEYGYISLSVREAAIIINPITFFGVGEDFTQMQISFEINKDCTFTIYEASDSVAETDTHTGSVSEGWDNIAWDKLTTTDTAVNFSISFVSGSLSTWINGSYAVAQVTFDVVLSDKTTTFDYVYLEGESTKAAAYAVYDINNLLRGSGTIPEGSFALSFEIWNKKSLTETFYGVKFTNGSSTDWINGTYYADDPEEYKGGGVVTVPPWWQDPMTWVLIGGFAALMFIATSGQKVGSLPNAPKGLK